MELRSQREETGDTACQKGQNRIRGEGGIIDVESFANNDVGWVANEEDHAGRVGCGESRYKPCYRI